MRIRKLRIHNYRSISELDMECLSMVTLLPNFPLNYNQE